jgi:TRAP-type C4-dicarboxylate transport system permease small subunit
MKALRFVDDKLEEILMTLLLIGIVICMSAQVISRRVFNDSLTWTDELARYLLVWSGFLSVSYCVKKRISIKIDQFQNMLPERAVPWIKMVRHTIVFLFCIAMLPYCVTYVQQAVASGATSSALKIPMYYIQSAPLVGFVLLAIRVAQAWVREFKASWRGMWGDLKAQLKAELREELRQEEGGKDE